MLQKACAPRDLLALTILVLCAPVAAEEHSAWRSKELRRFKAPEANQGVAVDEKFVYAIGNRQIAKYRKADGAKVAHWRDSQDGRFIHLNAGVVQGRSLFTAHSNYPRLPMVSSVEIWDLEKLRLIDSRTLGQTDGSLTWLDRRKSKWYGGFAHYARDGGMPGRGPENTRVVEFDEQWQVAKEWRFPKELSDRFAPNSCSCAAFGPGGYLYATGHDARELYVLQIPPEGGVLEWIATVPVAFEGQGFAWDPSERNTVYGICRRTQEVVIVRVLPPTPL